MLGSKKVLRTPILHALEIGQFLFASESGEFATMLPAMICTKSSENVWCKPSTAYQGSERACSFAASCTQMVFLYETKFITISSVRARVNLFRPLLASNAKG